MTTIYLIRHGHKHTHAGDPSLTELGFKQAAETGDFLRQFPIQKIIASPFKRTVETAGEISKALNLPYQTNPLLVERMNYADENVTRDEFFEEWVKSTNDREYTPKFGDSSKNAGSRVHQLVTDLFSEQINSDSENKTESQKHNHIVLVTHGGVIVDYLRNIFGDEKLAEIRQQYKDGMDFQMRHCAINKLVFDSQFVSEPKLKMLNFVEHLLNVSE